jgi:hypothetical protein
MFANLIHDMVAVFQKDRTELSGFRKCHIGWILMLKKLREALRNEREKNERLSTEPDEKWVNFPGAEIQFKFSKLFSESVNDQVFSFNLSLDVMSESRLFVE